MARLLLPSEYGLVAMLAIFLQISQVFIDSGFTNALIQRKNRTEVDYSTVFYFNIFIYNFVFSDSLSNLKHMFLILYLYFLSLSNQ